jgi:hypothetical protein
MPGEPRHFRDIGKKDGRRKRRKNNGWIYLFMLTSSRRIDHILV